MPTFFTRQRILLTTWAVVLFAFCLGLHLRHHRFPFYYHPDEPSKALQVITKAWNFHHPMLLLSTARLAVKLTHTPLVEQPVVEIGRTVSACFTAMGVVALALTAYLWRGWIPSLVTGVALATHHQLYELSHYMKEDSALLAGLGVSFLAALAYAQSPSGFRAGVLGLGCAMAISGKYLGVIVLGVALPVLWFDFRAVGLRRFRWFALVLVAGLLLFNWPLLADLVHPGGKGMVNASLSSEMQEVVHGQGALTRRVPHLLYWNVFIDNSTPAIWILLLAFLTRAQSLRAHERVAERCLAWFPVALTVLLSFSPKENDRYFLPATAMFTLLAALGASYVPNLVVRLYSFFGAQRMAETMSVRARQCQIALAIVLLWVLQLTGWATTKPGLIGYDQAFLQDDIAEMTAWVRANISSTAVILADSRAGLQGRDKKKKTSRASQLPQTLIVQKLASDRGTLEERRSQGVTHVVISESSYGRFFRGDLHSKVDGDPKFMAAQSFYSELLREGTLLFWKERGTVIYLHPGIRVYKL